MQFYEKKSFDLFLCTIFLLAIRLQCVNKLELSWVLSCIYSIRALKCMKTLHLLLENKEKNSPGIGYGFIRRRHPSREGILLHHPSSHLSPRGLRLFSAHRQSRTVNIIVLPEYTERPVSQSGYVDGIIYLDAVRYGPNSITSICCAFVVSSTGCTTNPQQIELVTELQVISPACSSL